MTRNLDATRNPMAFFGAEVRRVRLAASLSQDALGQKINFSGDMVGKVETCERAPTPVFAAACDAVFTHLDGHFSRLLELARRSGGASPQWFRGWLEAEQEATSLDWWEALLVPGLLQTAEYARALFKAWNPAAGDDELDELVSARMERQAIFDRPEPTALRVVVDEAVLYRLIGSRKVMYDQLLHLADMSCHPGITVQVLPAGIGAHAGLLGAFAIASFDNTAGTVYMESPDQGQTSVLPSVVGRLSLIFGTLRADALPRAASRDLIRKVAEERWTD